jgi:hypothetical protein
MKCRTLSAHFALMDTSLHYEQYQNYSWDKGTMVQDPNYADSWSRRELVLTDIQRSKAPSFFTTYSSSFWLRYTCVSLSFPSSMGIVPSKLLSDKSKISRVSGWHTRQSKLDCVGKLAQSQ